MAGIEKVVTRVDTNATLTTAQTALNAFLAAKNPEDIISIVLVAQPNATVPIFSFFTTYVNRSSGAGPLKDVVTTYASTDLATINTTAAAALAPLPVERVVSTQLESYWDGTDRQYVIVTVVKTTV